MLCAPLYRGRCCAYSIRAASALRSTKLMSRQTKVAHGATDANITMYPNWIAEGVEEVR